MKTLQEIFKELNKPENKKKLIKRIRLEEKIKQIKREENTNEHCNAC